MKVKVCGMREAGNIRAVESLGIDMMGFIFHPPSRRYCSEVPAYLPALCRRVGVFVNASDDFIARRVEDFALDILQLHGDETPERTGEIRRRFGLPVIKAVTLPCDCAAYDCDMLLFEARCDGYGGGGRKFDWTLLDGYRGTVPFLLTGGLGPDDARDVLALQHPMLAGIDLNSRFETAPGVKDVGMLGRFLEKLEGKTVRQ